MTHETFRPTKRPDHKRTPEAKAKSIAMRRIRATKRLTGGAL